MSDEICRDFDKADCRRRGRCKFLHPKLRICKDFQNKKCERESCKFVHVTREEEEAYDNSGKIPDHIDEKEAKRNRIMNVDSQNYGGVTYGKRRRQDSYNSNSLHAMPAPPAAMQENQMLKQKVMELQQQIMDLRQMNDTLYDQNTRYRNQLRSTAGSIKTEANLTSVGDRDLVGNRNYYDFSAVGR